MTKFKESASWFLRHINICWILCQLVYINRITSCKPPNWVKYILSSYQQTGTIATNASIKHFVTVVHCLNEEKFDKWSNIINLHLESQKLWSITESVNLPEDETQLNKAQTISYRARSKKISKHFSKFSEQFIEGYPIYSPNNLFRPNQVRKVHLQPLGSMRSRLPPSCINVSRLEPTCTCSMPFKNYEDTEASRLWKSTHPLFRFTK